VLFGPDGPCVEASNALCASICRETILIASWADPAAQCTLAAKSVGSTSADRNDWLLIELCRLENPRALGSARTGHSRDRRTRFGRPIYLKRAAGVQVLRAGTGAIANPMDVLRNRTHRRRRHVQIRADIGVRGRIGSRNGERAGGSSIVPTARHTADDAA
jgi:hypothetical protein